MIKQFANFVKLTFSQFLQEMAAKFGEQNTFGVCASLVLSTIIMIFARVLIAGALKYYAVSFALLILGTAR